MSLDKVLVSLGYVIVLYSTLNNNIMYKGNLEYQEKKELEM